MKKLLYAALFYFPLLIFAQPIETNNWTYADSNFSGRHCRGTHGLCKVNTTANKTMNNTFIVFNAEDKSVTFTIFKEKLTEAQEIQILGKPFDSWDESETLLFIMQNDFVFDDALRNELNLPNELYTIEKGEYPINIVSDTFIITFKLN